MSRATIVLVDDDPMGSPSLARNRLRHSPNWRSAFARWPLAPATPAPDRVDRGAAGEGAMSVYLVHRYLAMM